MKAAVTGGTGFIGKLLVQRLLAAGHDVRILSRKANIPHVADHGPAEVFVGDLSSRNTRLSGFLEGVDVLFHCAGEIVNEEVMEALHVGGTRSLLEANDGTLSQWIQLSSVGAYGFRRDGVITEETETRPANVYETTKTQSDECVMSASREQGFKLSIIRPANVIGPGMPNQSLFQMIGAIDRGLFVYFGKRGAMTNYVPASVVADALIACMDREGRQPETFILSEPVPLENVVEAICEGLGRKAPVLRLPASAGQILAGLLGGVPRFPLTRSRLDALTNRACYSAEKFGDVVGFVPRESVLDCMREMARMWKRRHGTT